MEKFKYRGFDMIENPDDPRFYALPLCDIMHSLIGDRDFSYISEVLYPLELTEQILHHLQYDKGVDQTIIADFSKRYLTEDSLCPIGKLLILWGIDKFNNMITELREMASSKK